VQILDNDQKRRQGQAPLEDSPDRKEYLPPELFGLDMLRYGVRAAETENVDIERYQLLGLLGYKAKL
jgi:hypothetical protein